MVVWSGMKKGWYGREDVGLMYLSFVNEGCDVTLTSLNSEHVIQVAA